MNSSNYKRHPYSSSHKEIKHNELFINMYKNMKHVNIFLDFHESMTKRTYQIVNTG